MPDDVTEPPIDWETEAIWAQKTALLMVIADSSDGAPMQTVIRQRGGQDVVARDTLQSDYVIIDATVYKPKFNPIRAVCLDRATRIGSAGAQTIVAAGDAILQLADGSLTSMPRHDFNCDYRIVGTGAERPSVGPFQ